MDGLTAAAVLGISPRATRREIVRAYRARAKQVHPDLALPASGRPRPDEDFITLRAAFECLVAAAPTGPTAPIASSDLAPVPASPPVPAAAVGVAPPAEPGPAPSSGRAFAAGSWFVTATVPAAPVIDLTDAAPLARIGSVVAPVGATRPEGRRFADCLAAELARQAR